MPPLVAIAIAIRYSVTVSMSDEMIGMFSLIWSDRLVSNFVSRGRTSLKLVASEMSSYVSAVPLCSLKKAEALL